MTVNNDTTVLCRPDWDEYFIDIAKLVSRRTTCLRRAVGCVITFENRILATGYNGTPSGMTHCSERGCMRVALNVPSGTRHELCWGLHGEQNALLQCCLHGISTKNAVLYSTTFPCSVCMKLLVNAQIKRIVYLEDYDDKLSLEILKESKIEMVKYEPRKKG